MGDLSSTLQQQVIDAVANRQPLSIIGGNSKSFYGPPATGDILQISAHHGIIAYEPTELVITARAGTPLETIRSTLQAQGQMLGFEPPAFGDQATLGGTIACNLSGPARPYQGAARDFVLGCHLLNGHGQMLKFGGEVIKNVAGYDVSRLMCGAMGTLGVLLDISLKVIPAHAHQLTLVQSCDETEALRLMAHWKGQPVPLTAACYLDGQLYLRLSGHAAAVKQARERIGGDILTHCELFWQQVREQQHPFFKSDKPLWRLSLPATTAFDHDGDMLIDWGGAQRWLLTDEHAASLRKRVTRCNGHAALFRTTDNSSERFHPLDDIRLAVHRQLKQAFDPQGIFNCGRLYPEL